MNTISFNKTVVANGETLYVISIPNTVIEALKQRKRLPKKLYVHWMLVSDNLFLYRVALGTSRDKYKNPLNEDNTTEIPFPFSTYIKMEEYKSHLEANATLWKITKWNGQTIALAKILFGYGTKIEEPLSYKKTIILTHEIKHYMNLLGRSKLYWKHVSDNTWLVSKDRKDYDAITWNAWDEIKLPPAVMKELGFYTGAEVEIEFTLKNDKPALLVRTKRYTGAVEDFLNDMLEENGQGIDIQKLYEKYLEYLKTHQIDTLDYYYYFIGVLENFHIIPREIRKQLAQNPEMHYFIPNYGLKTNKRGDDG